jgi:hypothetical protein
LRTSHFNEDGTNVFRSKIQIFVFLPSVITITLLSIVYIFPLFIQSPFSSQVAQNEYLDYGFEMVSNDTHVQDDDLIYTAYQYLYKESGITKQKWHAKEFFKSIKLQLIGMKATKVRSKLSFYADSLLN